MPVQLEVLIAYALGLFLLYAVGWLLLVPMKWILRLLANGVLGGLMLLLFNVVGAWAGLHVPVNVATALIAGFLGIPGVLMLIVLQFILV